VPAPLSGSRPCNQEGGDRGQDHQFLHLSSPTHFFVNF
jgi:hypothetical protein